LPDDPRPRALLHAVSRRTLHADASAGHIANEAARTLERVLKYAFEAGAAGEIRMLVRLELSTGTETRPRSRIETFELPGSRLPLKPGGFAFTKRPGENSPGFRFRGRL
jgi:predicted transcriptional regulator